jgi:hypothetical protein
MLIQGHALRAISGAFLLEALSHVLGNCLTLGGVPLLWRGASRRFIND